jgi:hypothetical protein
MSERIHKRLPVKFVEEVLESFNQHRISEKEAMDLLGVKRSRLHQLRKRWLLKNRKNPFRLWQRADNTFHVLTEEVRRCPELDSGFNTSGRKQICFAGSSTLPSWPRRQKSGLVGPFIAIAFGFMRSGVGIIMPYQMRRGRFIRDLRLRDRERCFNMTPLIISGFPIGGRNSI